MRTKLVDHEQHPTTYGGTTLTFDPENRMMAFGSVLTAGYNGDGLRAWKESASTRTYFIYDGIVPVVKLNSTGSVAATNTFGAAGLLSRREGSTSIFYSFDSEGNVSQRSNASGTVLSNYLFAAHGSVLSGTLSDPFGYKAQVGYYTDNETGMQLLTNRYYHPATGRFLTRDPISYVGGINLYSYVRNRPLTFMDSTGLILFGASYSASGIAGMGVLGAGGTAQYMEGVSLSEQGVGTGGATNVGAFGSLRALDGSGRDIHIGFPGGFDINSPGPTALGASFGRGFGGFISNAKDFGSLGGSFETTQLNTPILGFELDTSGDTWSFSVSGPSLGLSYARFKTYTFPCTTWDGPFHPVLPGAEPPPILW